MTTTTSWTDEKTEYIIGNLLRAGVTLSAIVVLAGGILYLVRYGHSPADYRVFRGEPTDLRHVSGIVRDGLALHSRGIIQLGLVLLIVTPVARVAFAVFACVVGGDRMYVVDWLSVFAIV